MPTKKINIELPLFCGFWIVFSAIMSHAITRREPGIDFPAHNRLAIDIAENGFNLSSMYRNAVALIMQLSRIDVEKAANILVFVMLIFMLFTIHICVTRLLEEIDEKFTLGVVALTAFAGSIPTPIFPRLFYYRAYGIRTWHNPTNFTVIPFVFLSFFFLWKIFTLIEKRELGEKFSKIELRNSGVLLSVVMILSVYGKPNWLAAFAPGVLIFLCGWWIKSKLNITRLKDCLMIGVSFIPAILYWLFLKSHNVHMDVSFRLGVDELVRPLPVLVNLMFPVYVIIVIRKSVKSKYMLLIAWFTYFVALCQRIFVIEVGEGRRGHGNTGWGLLFALNVLLMISAIEFVKYIFDTNECSKWKNHFSYIGIGMASLYFFGGLFYALHIYFIGGFAI